MPAKEVEELKLTVFLEPSNTGLMNIMRIVIDGAPAGLEDLMPIYYSADHELHDPAFDTLFAPVIMEFQRRRATRPKFGQKVEHRGAVAVCAGASPARTPLWYVKFDRLEEPIQVETNNVVAWIDHMYEESDDEEVG